jgi:hypothetical protein
MESHVTGAQIICLTGEGGEVRFFFFGRAQRPGKHALAQDGIKHAAGGAI